MANETGKPDFPQKQFETVLLHSLRVMDQNREYLQMHLARSCDEKDPAGSGGYGAGEHPDGADPAGDDGASGR